MDDLLGYIENELSMNKIGKECESSPLSSDSEEIDEKGGKVSRHIFNIELKLRAYLKENQTKKELFEKENFDSFLNDSKLKTPLSKIVTTPSTPLLIKNFFEDVEVVEYKRHSLFDKAILMDNLYAIQEEEKKYCKTAMEKKYYKEEKTKSISQFNEDVPENMNISNDNIKNFNFIKRDSIFKPRFSAMSDLSDFRRELEDGKNLDDLSEKSEDENLEEEEK